MQVKKNPHHITANRVFSPLFTLPQPCNSLSLSMASLDAELVWLTAAEQQAAMAAGEVTAVELCTLYLQAEAAGSNLRPLATPSPSPQASPSTSLTPSPSLTHALTLTSFLQRISDIDKNGPRLSSVLEVAPEALVHAAAADAERRVGGPH
eukprot:scaffold12738_cov81-Phaeocystis_antarctica.AAC.2